MSMLSLACAWVKQHLFDAVTTLPRAPTRRLTRLKVLPHPSPSIKAQGLAPAPRKPPPLVTTLRFLAAAMWPCFPSDAASSRGPLPET